jgi:hypothetical protein
MPMAFKDETENHLVLGVAYEPGVQSLHFEDYCFSWAAGV